MATRRVFSLFAVLALTAAKGPEEPTSKWRVDYGETQCVAMRLYGDRTLALRPSPRGESYEILLIAPGVTGRGAMQAEGSIALGAEPFQSTVLIYSDEGSHSKIYKFRVRAEDMRSARSADRIALKIKNINRPSPRSTGTHIISEVGGDSVDFALNQMTEVMNGLDACTADLRTYWNDGDDVAAGRTSPKGDVRAVFSGDDYPAAAMLRNQGGTTAAILMVDEKGDVAGCYNSLPSGIASLDATVCQVIIERAKFAPAKDREGKPTKSMVQTPRITFQLGGSSAPPVTPR